MQGINAREVSVPYADPGRDGVIVICNHDYLLGTSINGLVTDGNTKLCC